MSITTADRIRQIVREECEWLTDAETADDAVLLDAGLDSLDFIECVLALEERFEMDIPDDAWSEWRTIGDAARWVDEHK